MNVCPSHSVFHQRRARRDSSAPSAKRLSGTILGKRRTPALYRVFGNGAAYAAHSSGDNVAHARAINLATSKSGLVATNSRHARNPAPSGRSPVASALFSASGLRAGEQFGLEVKHFNGDTITVAQSVWEGRVQTPKTLNAFRQVNLHPSVSAMLRDFVGDRKQGFSSGLARGHHFFNRTSFVAFCTRFSKNSESRNRASTASAGSVSPTLSLAACHPPS
jgi:hypothetical protein